MTFQAWGENTPLGYRFRGRIYLTDILEGREIESSVQDCRRVRGILRAHGRPMSFSLIRSRMYPPMPPVLLAACLERLIAHDMGVSLDDWDLFETEEREA